jgi:predicted phage tail protein
MVIRQKDNILTGSGGLGGGKGKGQSRAPIESADNLISKDYARVVAVLSEGPIKGFSNADPTKSIKLDNTPLRNPDGFDNFKNYALDYRLGFPGQSKLAGSSAQSNTVNIGTKITTAFPVTHTVTDSATNAVRVTIGTPAFKQVDIKTGDILPTYVRFELYLSSGGGPYVLITPLEFNGKSAGNYSQDYELYLSGSAPWAVQVRRVTEDSTTDKVSNDIFFQRATEIKFNNNTYDNRAVLFAGFPAEYFQNIPEITAECDGLYILTPHNYNPTSRSYTGTFNGTLVSQFSNNPAWILYDLCVNDRYGASIPAVNLDVYSFYSLAQYCDELVPNGLGGYEPRYTFNSYITNTAAAYDLLQSVASSCRAKIYWAAGALKLVVDKPRTFSKIYSKANTIAGEGDSNFKYQTTPLDSRYTVVNVTWFDPSSNYDAKTDTVKDDALIASIGYNSTDITAPGATTRGQAIRYARWLIYTSCYQTKTVEFSIAIEALDVEPGEVCRIQDPTLNGTNRLGGRIKAVGVSTITLDSEATFGAGITYNLSIEGSGGLSNYIYTPSSTITTDTLPITVAESVNSTWLISYAGSGKDYQIVNIEEQENNTYVISAIEYSTEKWTKVENFTQSNLSNTLFAGYAPPPAPVNITVTESLYPSASNQQVLVKLNILWSILQEVTGIAGYEIGYKRYTDSTWITPPPTNFLTFDIYGAEDTTYNIRIRTIGRGGNSTYTYYNYIVTGLSGKPTDLTGFRINSDRGDNVELAWSPTVDLDVRIGGTIEIRHTALTSGATWIDGITLGYANGNQTSIIVPKAYGTYMAKTVDSSGNYCVNEAVENTSILTLSQLNIVATVDNSFTFLGVRDTVRYNGTSSITLSYTDQMNGDEIMNSDEIMNLDNSTVVLTEGYYYLTEAIDVGGVYNCNIVTTLVSNTFSTSDAMNNDLEIMDSNELMLEPSDAASCTSEIAISQDGTTFTDWRPFYTGTLLGRVFKFRLKLSSSDTTANVSVSQYKVTVDMPDRTESDTVTTSTLADTTVTFTNAFKANPIVVGNITNEVTSGERVVITGVNTAGFTIATFNSGGARISRNINYLAKGYGFN